MDDIGLILLCYAVGLILLLIELFVPSHGLLTVGSLASFGIAVFYTFGHSTTVGIIATVCCIVVVPVVLLTGLKYVQYLPLADQLAPTVESTPDNQGNDTSAGLREFIGQTGIARTPLHPVGMCEFDARKIPCVAESGMIDVGTRVVGVSVRMRNLAVRPQALEDLESQNTNE